MLADQLRDKMKSGVVALGAATDDGKVALLVVVTKDLTAKIKAGDLIKAMAAEVGGTGGGRPEMAQAGGKDPSRLDAALEKVFGLVERLFSGRLMSGSRILAFDYGTKRIGVALSDELGWTAQPLETL